MLLLIKTLSVDVLVTLRLAVVMLTAAVTWTAILKYVSFGIKIQITFAPKTTSARTTNHNRNALNLAKSTNTINVWAWSSQRPSLKSVLNSIQVLNNLTIWSISKVSLVILHHLNSIWLRQFTAKN